MRELNLMDSITKDDVFLWSGIAWINIRRTEENADEYDREIEEQAYNNNVDEETDFSLFLIYDLLNNVYKECLICRENQFMCNVYLHENEKEYLHSIIDELNNE